MTADFETYPYFFQGRKSGEFVPEQKEGDKVDFRGSVPPKGECGFFYYPLGGTQ